ncbi:MAG: Na+/H+ antiporter subunit E [Actinomycetota bacterium]|nr:Na+/H+ antiporter subunit E [Actinomycetota bacterium]
MIAWLTVVWVGLWGSPTPANVLGGLAVGAGVVALLPLTKMPSQGLVRPLALLRFLAFFAFDLVRASTKVVGQVLRPRLELRQAVVAVPVRGASDRLLTLLANVISLTPGTLTLEVDRPRATLYVHVLDVGGGPDAVERFRASILHLERLAILAVGSVECRKALVEDTGHAART